MSHELIAYLSIFNLFKLYELWPYYQKHVNQVILHNSLRLSFTNIRGSCSNFVGCKSFPESNSPNILAVWDKPGWLIWFWQFLCKRISSLNRKGFYYLYAWSRSLCEGRAFFCTRLNSKKLRRFLLTFLTGFTSPSVLLLFPLLITFFIFVHGFWFYFI